jgi:hypothetical protein
MFEELGMGEQKQREHTQWLLGKPWPQTTADGQKIIGSLRALKTRGSCERRAG